MHRNFIISLILTASTSVSFASHYYCFYSKDIPHITYISETNGYGTHTLNKVVNTSGQPLVTDPTKTRSTLKSLTIQTPHIKFTEVDFDEVDKDNPARNAVNLYSFRALKPDKTIDYYALDICTPRAFDEKVLERGCDLGEGVVGGKTVPSVRMFDCGSD